MTERAGYTRGAFYSNFASMTELIFAVYGQHMATVCAALDSIGERLASAPAPATIEQAVAAALEALPFDVNRLALLRIVAATGRHLIVDSSEFTQAMLAAHDGALAHSATTPDPQRLHVTLCTAVFSAMTADGTL